MVPAYLPRSMDDLRRTRLVRFARESRGWTLVELLIVIAVIAVLSTIATLVYSNVTERAKIVRASADIRTMDTEITTFEEVHGRLPVSLAELGRAGFLDPWGNPYEYLDYEAGPPGKIRKDHSLHPLNTSFDLYSKGKDGKSQSPITSSASRDDIIRANDGGYIGLASGY
jgi:general secretion pathway protein G